MGILDKLFTKKTQPEDAYKVIITETFIECLHPKWDCGSVKWDSLHTIMLINTDEGPWLPDIWLTLIDDNGICKIPHGCKGFDDIYDIVSKYNGFNIDHVTQSMSTTDNREFLLWTKNA
jgi:hypothetical protein